MQIKTYEEQRKLTQIFTKSLYWPFFGSVSLEVDTGWTEINVQLECTSVSFLNDEDLSWSSLVSRLGRSFDLRLEDDFRLWRLESQKKVSKNKFNFCQYFTCMPI